MNTILKIIFIFTCIFVVHEAGHAIIDGIDTSKHFYGIEFTGHGITSPGMYIYTIGESLLGRMFGFVLSFAFIFSLWRYTEAIQGHVWIYFAYVVYLSRWDFIASYAMYFSR